MKYALSATLVAIAAALLLTSCGENQPPQANSQPPANLRPNFFGDMARAQVRYSPNMSNSGTPGTPGTPAALNAGNPALPSTPTVQPPRSSINIPPDANWTLSCTAISGPDRFARIQQLKNYLLSQTKFKDWYVVHEANASILFHGFYSSVESRENPAAAARAHADRKAISEWKDPSGEQPFARCIFTPVVPPDPPAPAEWNLVNAPSKSHWSLQIAAFRDNALRKEAAVMAVKEMRSKGVEAYFYHGPTISSVCVGAWPLNSIKQQDADGGSAFNVTSEENSVLVAQGALPSRIANAKEITDKQGKKVDVLTERIEVIDPSMLAVMRDYPYHYTNYEGLKRSVRTADGKKKEIIDPPFIVKIPREDKSMLNDATVSNPTPPSDAPPRFDNTPAGGTRLPGLR